MNPRALLVFFVTFPFIYLNGQEFPEKNFEQYTTARGMSHNSVTGITQDSTGYMWIATELGLNRFNGSRFVQFHNNNDSFSLPSETLTGLTWLNKDQLAIYTTGLHIINPKTGKSRNLYVPYHDKQYQYKFNAHIKALGDDKGNVYILSRSGFYHFDKDHKLVYRFDYYSEEAVPVSHFFFGADLMELDHNKLLIVSNAGLYFYDKKKLEFKKMTTQDCPVMADVLDFPSILYTFQSLKTGHVIALKAFSDTLIHFNLIDNKKTVSRLPFKILNSEFHWRSRVVPISDTTFYITGHVSGFYKMRLYPETGQIKLYPQKYFSSVLCNTLFKDRDNLLWVATNKGLFREDSNRSIVEQVTFPEGMEEAYPNIRFEDVLVINEKIYAGTRSNGGLLIFDKKSLQFLKQVNFKTEIQRGNVIYSLSPVDSSNLLLGTDGPLFMVDLSGKKERRISPPNWSTYDWTRDLYRDSRGDVWISARNVYRYKPASKTFTIIPNPRQLLSVPSILAEDPSGHIWMGGHGIARYNTALDTFDIILDSFPYIKMPDKQVSAMAVDNQNIVWFNSSNNGLLGYDIKNKTFRHYTRNDGIPDDNIASLIVVGNRLWIACLSGLACMDLRTSQIIRFSKEDGLPDAPILGGSRFYYDSNLRQLYLGFSTAIVRFNPDDLLRRKSTPHLFIESITISDQNYFLPGQNFTTSWKDNDIRIAIGTISYSDGPSQLYAYRILKDELTPWTQMGSQPSFSISSLSPGTHRIQVKTYSPKNRWPDQVKEFSIEVLPPLWKKDWFIVAMGIVLFSLMYLLVRWRTEVVRKQEMEKTHIEKLKAEDYKNQFELEQISNYFSSSLADKKNEDDVLWDVANNLIGRLKYEDCIIYMWNKTKTKMIQKAAYGPKGKPEIISSQVFDVLPGQGIVGEVIQTLQPVLVNDTRYDKRYRVDDAYRLSEVCVPIIHNDELLGIIDSENHQANYFNERDIKILTTIATLIGNKLTQIKSQQTLAAKQKELLNINEQLAEARLSALQAQMNPHFVFNALNSIKRMILEGDNEKASRYLSKFALMIRMTLEHSKEIFVTLDENIEYIKAYLEMEQLRFDDSFTYNISAGENIELAETPVPSMMIQPLVENAIWHGLMQSTTDKKIKIGFFQEENRIKCTVEDNGIGIRQSEKLKEKKRPHHNSMGLENLQKRIKIMNEKYDMNCSLNITDLNENGHNGSGTRVELEFNIINA